MSADMPASTFECLKPPAARKARLILPQQIHDELMRHLFPGDSCEHAAVILAGWHVASDGSHRLLARELRIASEPRDYRVTAAGFNALQTSFIHSAITQCRDRRLVYLAIHNHGGSGWVAFSEVDLASHERGYPALRDIARGMPVGALVVADGAMEIDLWLPDGTRTALDRAEVIGEKRTLCYADSWNGRSTTGDGVRDAHSKYNRQELFLGTAGQALLASASVAVIGLGGVGSIVSELLSRLGVGRMVLVDLDPIESSNLSRVVGATAQDVAQKRPKIEIARRVALEANPSIDVQTVSGDFAHRSVANEVVDCDYLFLAADSMRARLVFNAIVQQFFIPGVQIGTKIAVEVDSGAVLSAHSFVRHVLPGQGCLLCNELIDLSRLAEEWKTDEERKAQQYGTTAANPSVITMNAIVAAHAVNEFLLFYVGLAKPSDPTPYRRFDHLYRRVVTEIPRRGSGCPECSSATESRYGMGDAAFLPCADDQRTDG